MLTLLKRVTSQKYLFKFDLGYVFYSQLTKDSDSQSINQINERKIDFDKAFLAS